MSSNILIVEDDPDIVKIYSLQLTNDGNKVVSLHTAQEALKYVKENKPDLVVLDIMLAGKMNGFDLLERIKSDNELKGIKILVLTNFASEEKVAKEIGADEYLVKANTTPKQLSEKVNKILARL